MMRTLSTNDILHIHAFLAKEFGGDADLRDETLLGGIVNDTMEEGEGDLFEKAAALMTEIANRAPFAERNARTAFFSTDVFLRMNGFYLRCDNVLTHRFFSALLEEGRFTRENLLPWIETSVEKINP